MMPIMNSTTNNSTSETARRRSLRRARRQQPNAWEIAAMPSIIEVGMPDRKPSASHVCNRNHPTVRFKIGEFAARDQSC